MATERKKYDKSFKTKTVCGSQRADHRKYKKRQTKIVEIRTNSKKRSDTERQMSRKKELKKSQNIYNYLK